MVDTSSRMVYTYGMKKQIIDKELLTDLHINQKLTVSEIARKLDKTFGVVKNNLIAHSIEHVKYENRPVSKNLQLISKDVLIDLHITKQLSVAEIARQLGKSFHVVKNSLKIHDIVYVEYRKIVISKEFLTELHINQNLSVAEISRKLGYDNATIKAKLIEHGIEFINVGVIEIPESELRYLHVEHKSNLVEIAKLYGCNESSITHNLKKYGIGFINHRVVDIDKHELKALHHDKELPATEISKIHNCDNTTICNLFRKYDIEIKRFSITTQHRKIKEFLDSHNIEYVDNDRSVISPLELDIYIPSKKLAIELNGVYWHSEKFKDKNYHYNKWKACNDIGIQLVQIWEDDFNSNPTRIFNFLENKLGLITNRVFARKCEIVEVSSNIAKHFHDINHIQGSCATSLNLAIKYDGEIISICSFKIVKGIHDLVRFSSSINVVGGFSKVLKYFKNNYEWNKIVTFADLCISNGNLYNLSGFKIDKILKPDYRYLVNGIRKHKFGYRLKRFATDDNLIYNSGLTEKELANLNGLERVYDAGKIRYEMVKGGN